MKPEAYARAIIQMVKKGETPKGAITLIHDALKVRGRTSLMPQIARAFSRLAAKDTRKNMSILSVARKGDEHTARKDSGAKEAELAIDTSLIGGWRLEAEGILKDASWKRYLLTMYNNATRA